MVDARLLRNSVAFVQARFTQLRGCKVELKRTSHRRKPRQFLEHGRAYMHSSLRFDTCMHTTLQASHGFHDER